MVIIVWFVLVLGFKNIDGLVFCREVNLVCFRVWVVDIDVVIVEGVMGLYDGWDGRFDVGSIVEMVKFLFVFVLLVFDCWILVCSVVVIIWGYIIFDFVFDFVGVVFNKVLLLLSLVYFNLLIVFDWCF